MNLGVLLFTPQSKNFNAYGMPYNAKSKSERNNPSLGLVQDTVSFGVRGVRSKKNLSGIVHLGLRSDKVMNSHYNTAINLSMANDICKGAVAPMKEFRRIMHDYLRPFIATSTNYERPIEKCNFRVKKPSSLLAKLNSQDASVQRQISRDKAQFLQDNSGVANCAYDYLDYVKKSDAMKGVSDIIGGRIILRDPSKFSVGLVLDALAKAVKEGKLVVTELENYHPKLEYVPQEFINAMRRDFGVHLNEQKIKDMTNPEFFSYASSADLKNFKKVCLEKNPDFKMKDQDLPSGYQGIHIGVQLSDGYKGEIQIFGRDVHALKEMEDERYKALCGKSANPNSTIAKRFAQLRKEGNEKLKEADAEYTYWSYLAQRLKGVIRYKEPLNMKFLTAPSIVRVAGLDWNDIYTIL